MKGKTCFFIGHHDAPESIFPVLLTAVSSHIEMGINHFIVGHYGSFDRMAARAVRLQKLVYPEITLSLLSPYHPNTTNIKIPEGFDDIIYPFENPPPKRFAIVKANQYAVKHSNNLIAYVIYSSGNAYKILHYARRREEKHLLKITLI